MKRIAFLVLGLVASTSTVFAGVECDCNLVVGVTQNYQARLPVSRVAGVFQIDAGARCESDVKAKVKSMIIQPKAFTSQLSNCVQTSPVVTE